MKRLISVIGLCVLLIACKQSPNTFTLTVSDLPVTNDIYVYDLANPELIDTIKIIDGSGSHTFGGFTAPKLLVMTDKNNFMRYIIGENGHLTLVGDTGVVTGSELNNRLSEFSKVFANVTKEISAKKTAILSEAKKEERQLNDEEYSTLKALDKERVDALIPIVKKYYAEDKDNILGVLQLMYYQYLVPEEDFLILYEQGGDVVRNYPSFVRMMEAKANFNKTQAGEKFVDLEGVNPNDTTQTLKLSEYVGKHKYVLLDFWASWCGPCKAAMPELKKMNDNYSGKGLEIIGIVVSDEIDAHLASAKELNVTWTQIFDNKNTANSLYGIKGIPTLILLDEDGTILLRTYNKDEVKEKLESLLGK